MEKERDTDQYYMESWFTTEEKLKVNGTWTIESMMNYYKLNSQWLWKNWFSKSKKIKLHKILIPWFKNKCENHNIKILDKYPDNTFVNRVWKNF